MASEGLARDEVASAVGDGSSLALSGPELPAAEGPLWPGGGGQPAPSQEAVPTLLATEDQTVVLTVGEEASVAVAAGGTAAGEAGPMFGGALPAFHGAHLFVAQEDLVGQEVPVRGVPATRAAPGSIVGDYEVMVGLGARPPVERCPWVQVADTSGGGAVPWQQFVAGPGSGYGGPMPRGALPRFIHPGQGLRGVTRHFQMEVLRVAATLEISAYAGMEEHNWVFLDMAEFLRGRPQRMQATLTHLGELCFGLALLAPSLARWQSSILAGDSRRQHDLLVELEAAVGRVEGSADATVGYMASELYEGQVHPFLEEIHRLGQLSEALAQARPILAMTVALLPGSGAGSGRGRRPRAPPPPAPPTAPPP